MSVNVYLNKRVRDMEGFTAKPYPDGSGDSMKLNGMTMSYDTYDKSSLYFSWDKENPIPAELDEFVEGVSIYEHIAMARTVRETGVYKLGSAQAEVDFSPDPKYRTYFVKIRGKKLEDARDLLHAIKTGSIRPTESYEGPQQGLSREQLLDALDDRVRQLMTLVAVVEDLRRPKTPEWIRHIPNSVRSFWEKMDLGNRAKKFGEFILSLREK